VTGENGVVAEVETAAARTEFGRLMGFINAARAGGIPDDVLAREVVALHAGPDVNPVEAYERIRATIGDLPNGNRVADPVGVDRLVEEVGPGLTFRTVDELRDLAASSPRQWVVHGLLARGAVSLLGAKPKAGKTTLLAALLSACERGEEIAGFTTEASTAVYLSEEPAILLVDRCDRFAVERAVFLCREDFSAVHSFAQFVEAGAAEAARRGAAVLVVDTYARFARLGADGEKDAGVTQEIMESVLAAASSGLAVVLVTHLRKGDGEEGEAFRGSTALTGAADILIELRRASDDLREITCYSRFAESPVEPVLIRMDGDHYVREEGEGMTREVESGKSKLLTVLRHNGELTRKDLFERVPMRHQARLEALAALLTAGSVVKSGSGRRGDPHVYGWVDPGGGQCVEPKDVMEF
jgi:hypothetical protein